MSWSTNAKDAKMLLDTRFPMNSVKNDRLALNLVGVCLDSRLQTLSKSFPYFAKIGKIDCSKIAKIWLVKFECST